MLIRFVRASLLALTAAFLVGCGPLITQSPGGSLTPVNAVSQGDAERLFLHGHDLVSYFTEGTHAMGVAQHQVMHEDIAFWFKSKEHKDMFVAAPEKYLPAYGGYCTNGIAYGIPWGGSANTWKILDGKLYIFGGQQSMDAFLLDTDSNMALAEKYWKEEVSGSNAFWQRTKRMIFRVPHYKSGQDLADEIAKAKKT